VAVDVLFTADMLFIEKLKTKTAVIISTLGNGTVVRSHTEDQEVEVELINIYDVIQAGWQLRVQRLEVFAARYLAYRLENYIDEADFEDLIRQSASRIQKRQETDSIELLDDIRYYLSERFRLRFEDAGLDEMMDEEGEISAEHAEAISDDNLKSAPATENAAAIQDLNPKPIDAPKNIDEAIDVNIQPTSATLDSVPNPLMTGEIRTLEGDIAGDEFATDAFEYQVLLGKIDTLLERLKLDA